ncbi:MAG: sterol desaturase family protein [Candidatus Kapaibacterium sp.]
MDGLIETLRGLSLPVAAILFLAENIIIAILAVGFGNLLARVYAGRPVSHPPEKLSRAEILYSTSTIILNSAITFAGFLLWRAGIVHFREDVGFGVLLDILLITIVMDFAMYVLHRAAHLRFLFPILHRTHHHYDRPRPLTLFVLNPFEALSFGSLWLIVISLYSASWLGMSIYLGLNVLFGMIGHIGVEPFPDSWKRIPVLRYISTSTFHAQHHHDREWNYGFYTLIWDRIFGTLSPRYDKDFGRTPGEK